MAVNSLDRKKLDKIKKQKAQEFKDQIKKFEKRNATFNDEQEKKSEVIDLYQNMSATQKAAFEKELELKKIRDNYSLYLKYF